MHLKGDSTASGVVGAEIGKRAVENNHFGDDISPTEERKQTVEMFAKTLFKDKENAEKLAETYYDALQMGEAKSLVEGVKGTVEAITNLDETVATLANILQDPKGTFDKVIISAEQWNKQLNWALENDPVLAAEMQGYMVGAGRSLEMPSLLLTGEAAKVFQKVVKNNAVGKIETTDIGNLGIDNPKYNKIGNEKINNADSYLSDLLPRDRAKDFILPIGKQSLDPTTISFSQASISYGKRGKDYNFDTLVESMKKDGWKGDPIDVVNMLDGAPTSLDNTRILAARQAGIKVEATIHNYNEKLSAFDSIRFSHNGVKPTTWGEAVSIRIQRQSEMKGVPNGWNMKNPMVHYMILI